jgi:hypothetical protein
MKSNLTIFFLSIISFSFAQKPTHIEKSGEKGRGSKADITIHQTIQALDGSIVAVGETTTNTNGGKDGYITIFSPISQERIEKTIGGTRDDILKSIAQLNDGSFLIVGSTKSKANGKESAWAVYIDGKGDTVHERIFNKAGEDAFHAVVATPDGGAFLFGSFQEKEQGELNVLKIRNNEIEVEKKLDIGGYVKDIKSAVLAHDGSIVIVGNTQKTKTVKDDNIWVAKINIQEKEVVKFAKTYGEVDKKEQANQIIRTADKGFAIVGTINNIEKEGYNAWLLKLHEDGTVDWQENYGGRDIDMGYSVAQIPNDFFYIVGKTRSHNSDALTSQIYIVKISPSGEKKWEDYDGEKRDDWGNYITVLSDGSCLLTAMTDDNTWFYRFRDFNDIIENTANADGAFRRAEWRVQTDSRYLEADKRTALGFLLTNISPNTIKNIQIVCESPTPYIKPQKILYLSAMRPNEAKWVSIPIKTEIGLDENDYTLNMEMRVGNYSEKFSHIVKTKKGPPQYAYIKTPPQYQKVSENETIVTLIVENPTAITSDALTLSIELPTGFKTDTATKKIKPILAGKTAEVTFTYRGQVLIEGREAKPKIKCQLLKNTDVVYETSVDAIPLSTPGLSGNSLVWKSPDEFTTNLRDLTVYESNLNIELYAIANERLTLNNFDILIDEKPIVDTKMDVAPLPPATVQGNQYKQLFKRQLLLEPNKIYRIKVVLKTKQGETHSEVLTVKYNQGEPNLHVVTIGTTNTDIKYAAKDARDIARFFNNTPTTPFKKIFVTDCSDSIKTLERPFRRTFADLVKRANSDSDSNKIEGKDYLFVFISSHGKTDDDKQFKLIPTNYDPAYPMELIDYQTDVLAQLDKIKCHKIVFIDACHSAAAKGAKSQNNYADAVIKASQAAKGTTIFTSCRSEEYSYEDDTWQNGAFTKALLEAFSNTACDDEEGKFSSDDNKDKQITINEIKAFIEKRVPKMVALQKKERQTPMVTSSELDGDIPLVLIENH